MGPGKMLIKLETSLRGLPPGGRRGSPVGRHRRRWWGPPTAWRVVRLRLLRPGGRQCGPSSAEAAPASGRPGPVPPLWVTGAVPWWPPCGRPGWRPWPVGLYGCCPGGSGGLRRMVSGLGGVQRHTGGALVARSASAFPCNLVSAVPWWHGRPRPSRAISCRRHRGGALGSGRAVAPTVFRCSATMMWVKTFPLDSVRGRCRWRGGVIPFLEATSSILVA
jgi:hypothetical protein